MLVDDLEDGDPFAGLAPALVEADAGALSLSKPPGMTIFPSRMHPRRPCLLAWLTRRFPEQAALTWPEGFDGGILHRLDTATSGLVRVARSLISFEVERGRFAGGALRKRYLLISGPAAADGPVEIDIPLAHHARDKRKMVPMRGPRTSHRGRWYPAHTTFTPLAILPGGAVLWEALMRTGVTHQIRAHAALAGLPLLGDGLYGGAPSPGPAPAAAFFLHHLGFSWESGATALAPIPPAWRPLLGAAGERALASAGLLIVAEGAAGQ